MAAGLSFVLHLFPIQQVFGEHLFHARSVLRSEGKVLKVLSPSPSRISGNNLHSTTVPPGANLAKVDNVLLGYFILPLSPSSFSHLIWIITRDARNVLD